MKKMKIAVSGWYFDPELLRILNLVPFDVTVVTYNGRASDKCNRPSDIMPASVQIANYVLTCKNINHVLSMNGGLEFGVYDWYIKKVWDGKSPVLFMHDDIKVYDVEVFADINNQLQGVDQAYIFRDEVEEVANGRKHGRGIYCSARFIKFMLEYVCSCGQANDHEHPHYPNEDPQIILKGIGPHSGFFFDPYNLGEHASGKVPYHCRHYNAGIYHFDVFAGRCVRVDGAWPGFNTKVVAYFPDFNSGRRGMWTGKVYSRGKEIAV